MIAGVSGSRSSRRAVRIAAEEAAVHGYSLRLLHAFNWLPALTGTPQTSPARLLEQAAEQAADAAPLLTVDTELVEGPPLQGLLRRSRGAVLMVVGDGDLESHVCLPRDTLPIQLAARATVSVMVTRASPVRDGPVLAGVSGADNAEAALDVAFDMAAHRRTGLIVMHAWQDPGDPRDVAVGTLVEARVQKYGIPAQMRLVEGDPIEVMRRESGTAGLIVVGARGRRPYRGLLGSVTQTLLHHGSAPVVVVRGVPWVPEVPDSGALRDVRVHPAAA
ncbi:universal stress protein [Actinoplanes sp. NPDC023714]|uniref:universal stress protein n=1 Tax=Actinoplanes sp. NPDC023714 TaxID=3154322 RepID=UPI0033EEB68C